MVPHVAPDNHRREVWIDLFRTHDHLFARIMVNDNVGPKGNQLKGSESPLGQLPACLKRYMAQKEPPLFEQFTGDLGGACCKL